MKIYRFAPEPLTSGPSELQEISLKAAFKAWPPLCPLTKPTVFFFPGVQTVDKGRRGGEPVLCWLTRKSDMIERHLGGAAIHDRDDAPNVFTVTYSRLPKRWDNARLGWVSDGMGRGYDIGLWARDKDHFYTKNAKRWAKRMILPALKDEDGEWRSRAEIEARFDKLTIVGDSYGGIFAEMVANVLRDAFRGSGRFSESAIEEMLGHIVMIGASNVPLRTGQKNTFTGIYFEGRGDTKIEYTQTLLRRVRDKQKFSKDTVELAAFAGLPPAPSLPPMVSRFYRKATLAKDFFLDTPTHTELGFEQAKALADRGREMFVASPPAVSDLAIDPVDKGAIVAFNVPTEYDLMIRQDKGFTGAHFPNKDRHESASYLQPIPGRPRDHADLFGRVLRNALKNERRVGVECNDLILQPAPHPGLAREEAAAIEHQLDRVCRIARDRPPVDFPSPAATTGHVAALRRRQETYPAIRSPAA